MAITAFKTFISGEVLLASDLNSSLTTIINEVNVHGSELDTINGSTQGRSRNLIINGDFSVWQRGTSQTSSGYGSSDRWYNEHSVSTKTTSQQAFTLGQTTVPGNPKYYQRTIAVTGSTSSSYTLSTYRMEDVTKTAGREVTISFWAKADAAKDIALEIRQIFGTGGSPSSSVDGDNTKVSLTTSWQKFTVTLTYNSISGKSLGTNGDDYASINFWYDAGSTFDAKTGSLGNQSGTFDISNVQLEFGDTATEFEYVTPADQLARCQRYTFVPDQEEVLSSTVLGYGLAGSSTNAQIGIMLPVSMREGDISVTITNPTKFAVFDGATTTALTNLALNRSNRNVVDLLATTAGLTQFRPYKLVRTVDTTGLIVISAEL